MKTTKHGVEITWQWEIDPSTHPDAPEYKVLEMISYEIVDQEEFNRYILDDEMSFDALCTSHLNSI